ncbi:hypothetical protein [Morganella morganii IS15]|nr:hypothetical protein [Morganella morganii IS15]
MVFPALCYQPKINKSIFLVYFYNLCRSSPTLAGLSTACGSSAMLMILFMSHY